MKSGWKSEMRPRRRGEFTEFFLIQYHLHWLKGLHWLHNVLDIDNTIKHASELQAGRSPASPSQLQVRIINSATRRNKCDVKWCDVHITCSEITNQVYTSPISGSNQSGYNVARWWAFKWHLHWIYASMGSRSACVCPLAEEPPSALLFNPAGTIKTHPF